MLRAVLKARDLTGTFDKPRYMDFTEELCAHSRSRIVGCRRCLDLCPTGAITPAGNHVSIDPNICAGCGQCAAVCPTGAAAYALPPADTLLRKLRATAHDLRASRRRARDRAAARRAARCAVDRGARAPRRRPAGERAAALGERGDAGRARGGRRRVCLWGIGAALSHSRQAAPRCGRAAPRRSRSPTRSWPGSASARAASPPSRPTIRSRSATRCARSKPTDGAPRPAAFTAVGAKRDVLRLALRELHHAAPAPVDIVPLPEGAPFGTVRAQRRGLHALPRLRLGVPDRRAVRRAGPAAVALRRGCLRAVRAVQGDVSREGDQPQAAARLPRLDRARARAEGGRAVLLHPLQQAVRREVERRARRRQARRQALDVPEFGEAPRRDQDVRRLPRDRDDGGEFRSVRRARAARTRAPRKTICASGKRRAKADYFVAFARKSVSALRSASEPMRCSGILVPGV